MKNIVYPMSKVGHHLSLVGAQWIKRDYSSDIRNFFKRRLPHGSASSQLSPFHCQSIYKNSKGMMNHKIHGNEYHCIGPSYSLHTSFHVGCGRMMGNQETENIIPLFTRYHHPSCSRTIKTWTLLILA